MQDFDLNEKKNTDNQQGELTMTVSAVCEKNDRKIAYVTFSDGVKTAEGIIPECTMEKNDGFTDDEVEQLIAYMRSELPRLKKMASQINVMSAFMGKRIDE